MKQTVVILLALVAALMAFTALLAFSSAEQARVLESRDGQILQLKKSVSEANDSSQAHFARAEELAAQLSQARQECDGLKESLAAADAQALADAEALEALEQAHAGLSLSAAEWERQAEAYEAQLNEALGELAAQQETEAELRAALAQAQAEGDALRLALNEAAFAALQTAAPSPTPAPAATEWPKPAGCFSSPSPW